MVLILIFIWNINAKIENKNQKDQISVQLFLHNFLIENL